MSTSGGREDRNHRRFASLTAYFGVAIGLVLVLLGPGPSVAATPEGPGQVVFSNHGRIVSVKADGTGRTVLTRKNWRVGTRNKFDEYFPMGDSLPAVSADGTRLAFLRTVPSDQDWTVHVMVAGRDGSNPVRVASFVTGFIQTLEWSGERIVFTRVIFGQDDQGEFEDDEIVSLAADGSDEEVIFSRRFRVKPGEPMAWQSAMLMDVSADGRELLYLYGNLKGSWLRLHDLDSGKERLVAKGVQEASLSPDGSTVAFVAAQCYENQCKDKSWPQPGLWRVGADGAGAERILPESSEITSPDFSPDGERIVFASDRNFPNAASGAATEIYTVRTDGTCLAWITNGSPASSEPSWTPEALDSAPRSCGTNGLKPLVEFTPPRARSYDAQPRLWAGPAFDGRLLSSVSYIVPGTRWESYTYGDCGAFDPARCKTPIAIESGPVCGGPFGPFMPVGEVIQGSKRRGGLLITSRTTKGRVRASMFSTGGVTLYIGRSSDSFGGSLKLSDHLRLLDRLRRVGEPRPSALPGPKIRKRWVKLSARVSRVMKRTGSVAATAKHLEMTRPDVRFGLGLGSLLPKFKPLRTVQCGRTKAHSRTFGVKFR